MKKLFFGLMGLLMIVVMVSGCISTAQKENVIFDKNIGSSGSNVQYVNVPSDAQIRVEISNSTILKDPYFNTNSTINFYGLNIDGQNGQSTSNYASNIVDEKSFSITNGFVGNSTFKSGLKSVAIVTNDAKANIKIVTIN